MKIYTPVYNFIIKTIIEVLCICILLLKNYVKEEERICIYALCVQPSSLKSSTPHQLCTRHLSCTEADEIIMDVMQGAISIIE